MKKKKLQKFEILNQNNSATRIYSEAPEYKFRNYPCNDFWIISHENSYRDAIIMAPFYLFWIYLICKKTTPVQKKQRPDLQLSERLASLSIMGPIKVPPRYDSVIMYEVGGGFQGNLNWTPMMPRETLDFIKPPDLINYLY